MRTETKVNGITEGRISSQLLLFFFPILFGTFFQQLYNTVDAIVVGQYLGTEALAAVGGGTGTAINLLIGFFTGLSSGATVIISQYYGAKDYKDTSKAIHTAIMIALIGGVLILAIGILFTRPILELIGTPDDVIDLAESYMRIYFLGSIFNTVYNMGAGIFRALGDSKKPLYFLIVSCLVNIVLDILLVGFTDLGVAGAAWATIFSQAASAVLVLIYLRKLDEDIKLKLRELKIDPMILKGTMRIGLPAGIQSVLYTISNLIIQANVNSFGTATAAAWAAYGKLDAVFWMAINAFGIAATTFVGQNYGARLYDRVRSGVKISLWMGGVMTILISGLFLLLQDKGLMLFTTDQEVLSIGVEILLILVPTWITYMPIEILSGVMRGCGKTLIPTIITVVGICVLRALWLEIVPAMNHTLLSVFFCYPLSWVITSAAIIIYYFFGDVLPKRKKQ
ncbi:MAG TPA: MATE family efflux transporter [Candidatus Ornithospirochaeta stercorigallinarum]|nr:MATE family efflux transporter [Candidatus Ornithospirochaeta stercorigallinarum]